MSITLAQSLLENQSCTRVQESRCTLNRTDWFHAAKWGVFVHILADAASNTSEVNVTPEEWNRRIDGIDVDGLARQLAEVKAGYVMITIGQNSGFYLSPNASYDRIVGHATSRCSRRDLVADLQKALEPYSIPVIAYLPTCAPLGDAQAIQRLRCTPPWDPAKIYMPKERYSGEEAQRTDARLTEFQRNWEEIVGEWSERWGTRIRGWWFDGVYCADLMYRNADEPNFASFARAARRGNPESILAWNPGVLYPQWPVCMDAEEDYLAGEVNEPARIDSPGRWFGHEQFHVLSYMGKWWGAGPIRFTREQVLSYTRAVTDYGGVFSWDVPFQANGMLTEEVMTILRALSKAIEPTRGIADSPPPQKIPQAVITVPASPVWSGKGNDTCRISVTLTNPWDRPISGTIRLSAIPAAAAQLEHDRISYTLQPGKKSEQSCSVRLLPEFAAAPMSICLQREPDPRITSCRQAFAMQVYDSALPETELMARIMTQAPLRAMAMDRLAAEIRWAVQGSDLVVQATVRDAVMSLGERPWEGSCMELFVAAADGEPIGQLILTPATITAGAMVWKAMPGGLQAMSEVPYVTSCVEGGYSATARIALPDLLLLPVVPETFLIEMVVTAGDTGLVRSCLFNSIHAANLTTAGYAAAILAIRGMY